MKAKRSPRMWGEDEEEEIEEERKHEEVWEKEDEAEGLQKLEAEAEDKA